MLGKNMSAGDEDTELRDLVTQTLENNGLLGKIQAQLRAGVFLALEDTDKKVTFNSYCFFCIVSKIETNKLTFLLIKYLLYLA